MDITKEILYVWLSLFNSTKLQFRFFFKNIPPPPFFLKISQNLLIIYLFIYLFVAADGLLSCSRGLLSCGMQKLLVAACIWDLVP